MRESSSDGSSSESLKSPAKRVRSEVEETTSTTLYAQEEISEKELSKRIRTDLEETTSTTPYAQEEHLENELHQERMCTEATETPSTSSVMPEPVTLQKSSVTVSDFLNN